MFKYVLEHVLGGQPTVHNLTLDAFNAVPAPAASLDNGEIVCTVLSEPVLVSGVKLGGATMVGVIVELPVCPRESVDWYVTGDATPVNAPVQPMPEGSLLALHGWKDTDVPDTVYLPSTPEGPVTTRDVAVQLGYT
jgi:hypothetical protein